MLSKEYLEKIQKEGIWKLCDCEECGKYTLGHCSEITLKFVCRDCQNIKEKEEVKYITNIINQSMMEKEHTLVHYRILESLVQKEMQMGSHSFKNNCDSETLTWNSCPVCESKEIQSLLWCQVHNNYVCYKCDLSNNYKKRDKIMTYNIAIDADSIIMKAISRHQPKSELIEDFDIEKAYFEFCGEVAKIKSAVFEIHQYEKDDEVNAIIVFSPKKTFRYDFYPEYKANRKDKKMMIGRRELTLLVMERVKSWTMIVPNIEADDVVIWLAKNKGYMVSAIDKDIISVCPTHCYNYNQAKWNQPVTQMQSEAWYCLQALMGDTADNIKGAPGIGETGALRIMHGYEPKDKNAINISKNSIPPNIRYEDIIKWFPSEYDALLNMRLVRMDQWTGKMDGSYQLWKPDGDLI